MMQLLLAGDVMLGRGVNEKIRDMGPSYPLEALAPLIRAADLLFVNLECALSPRNVVYRGPPKAFYFRADPPAVETLTHAGADLASLANNHTLDADVEGLNDTLSILDQEGIAHTGAGRDLEAASWPALIERGGQRLGVLSYCDHQEDFAAGLDRPGICYVDLDDPLTGAQLAEEVEALAARVDHVIVAFHWQPNYAPRVAPRYRDLARTLVHAGASVIWGHSPHHFQGVEWLDRSVVIYSSGDFVSDYAVDPEFRNDLQLLFQVTLHENGVECVRAYPLELDFARTRPAGEEARGWIVRRFRKMCLEVGSRVEEREEWFDVHPERAPI